MADLSPAHRALVESWAAEGATLNQIQDRLRRECEVTLTYMEARLLMMDLKVKLQDKPREVPVEQKAAAAAPAAETAAGVPAAAQFSVSADEFPLQGAAISGKATFSDGESVVWFMDTMGRFGMNGPFQGYQPPAADIPKFQSELDQLLQLRGF